MANPTANDTRADTCPAASCASMTLPTRRLPSTPALAMPSASPITGAVLAQASGPNGQRLRQDLAGRPPSLTSALSTTWRQAAGLASGYVGVVQDFHLCSAIARVRWAPRPGDQRRRADHGGELALPTSSPATGRPTPAWPMPQASISLDDRALPQIPPLEARRA